MMRGRVGFLAVAAALAALECAHTRQQRPCPTPRPFAKRAAVGAPAEAATRPAIEAAGGRYHVCGDGLRYVVTRPGERELTDEDISVVFNQRLLRGLSTVSMRESGYGPASCPDPGSDRQRGLVARVPENAVTPAQILEDLDRLGALAQAQDATLRALVLVLSAPGPRCAKDDPACTPVPYSAACAEQTDYDPSEDRRVVQGGSGSCNYDGECAPGGCGNECTATSEIDVVGLCDGRGSLAKAWCGCVKGGCAWFVQ